MERLFTNTIRGEGILWKHARGISERSGKEFHSFYEVIWFLGGEAEFISEDLHMRLKPETLIFIPQETYHQMIIHKEPEGYHRCLLQFSADAVEVSGALGKLGGIKVFGADAEIRYLLGKLTAACDGPDRDSGPLLKAVLTFLLCSLGEKQTLTGKENCQIQLIRQATDYINRNTHNRILLTDIAAECNVSLSALCHVFKKEMNISIHKFIVKKRLVNAKQRIAAGQSPTAAAMDCGFQDYSGFYKQYKKMFGVSPSHRNGA